MWHTSTGDRTLEGAEAALIRAAVADMTDVLQDEADGRADEWPCGVELFDELSWRQRLALLARVAKALLDPAERAPELAAVNEAAVGALFASIDRNLTIELDHAQEPELPPDYDRRYWRRLVSACQGEPNDEFYVDVDSTTSDDWRCLIESLQDGILWDGDWDMPELFMDVKPELSDERKGRLGIDQDYFVSPSPDIRETDVLAAFDGLRRLVGDDR